MGLLEAIHDAEIDLFRAMNLAGTNGLLDSLMILFTILGISYVIILVCVPLWLQGKKDAAIDVVVLIIVATLAAEALKLIFDRPRPSLELDDVRTLMSASGPSFPSAHAARAFAVACLICIVEPRKFGLTALLFATLISVSRVYLGVHWPSDVLVGAILGALIAVGLEESTKRSECYKLFRQRIISMPSRKRV